VSPGPTTHEEYTAEGEAQTYKRMQKIGGIRRCLTDENSVSQLLIESKTDLF